MDRLRRLFFALLIASSAGCNLQAMVIRATTGASDEVAREKALELADPELVGPVMAESTVVNEGYLYYVPDDEALLMSAIFGNVGYGALWLQVEAEEAELAGDFARVEHLNRRTSVLFARAQALAKRLLRLWDDGFDEAVNAGDEKFQAWVDENFYEKKDANVLLTAGTAYFATMIQSEEGLAAAVDLPYARVMVERSVELDPELSGAQGLMLLGSIECTVPEQMGGRPKVGLRLMQRAAQLTHHENHGVLVMMAQRCAVALQDRELFDSTLRTVIDGKDAAKYRLTNKIARRQAMALVKQAGDLFYD
jgi:hypothetical protein